MKYLLIIATILILGCDPDKSVNPPIINPGVDIGIVGEWKAYQSFNNKEETPFKLRIAELDNVYTILYTEYSYPVIPAMFEGTYNLSNKLSGNTTVDWYAFINVLDVTDTVLVAKFNEIQGFGLSRKKGYYSLFLSNL